MAKINSKVKYAALLAGALVLSGCKQVALITASDSSRELASQAESGDAQAAYRLGMRYTQGLGETQNYSVGLDYFETAAELGLKDAQYMLGMGYYLGRGTAVDYPEARRWLMAAAEQGHVAAKQSLGEIYYNGYGVARAPVLGIYWSLQAAEQGDSQAQYLVAISYLTGLGSNKSAKVGQEWLQRAAAAGDERAETLMQTLKLNPAAVRQPRVNSDSYHQTRYIQLRLSQLGQNPGAIDGLWGGATERALQAQFGRVLTRAEAFAALAEIAEPL